MSDKPNKKGQNLRYVFSFNEKELATIMRSIDVLVESMVDLRNQQSNNEVEIKFLRKFQDKLINKFEKEQRKRRK